MRIIFVRHGHPNYSNDCLTEVGHLQAEAAARRLSSERIHKIYSSSCGRAMETAVHIADAQGMKVELCDFMRELTWGSIDDEPILYNGHPWFVSDNMISVGKTLMREDWGKDESFCKNKIVSQVQQIGFDFDCFLAKLGYNRDGNFYRVCKSNHNNIVMVSHGGSSSAVFSHIFNLPMPFVCTAIRPGFTAITVITFCGENGSLISPQFEFVNDMQHISDIAIENLYDN